jgi:predicted nucleic acid-binding protein
MIVLDTNVVSEFMKATPDAAVVRWIGARSAADHYTTSITQAEILYGIQLLPAGKRRNLLRQAAEGMFAEDFAGRVLGFGIVAAPAYARIASEGRRLGRPISHFDAQIAAIAEVSGASIATRNVDDFAGLGLTILNPWIA